MRSGYDDSWEVEVRWDHKNEKLFYQIGKNVLRKVDNTVDVNTFCMDRNLSVLNCYCCSTVIAGCFYLDCEFCLVESSPLG